MGLTYFKRYRMDYDLGQGLFPAPKMEVDYQLLPWSKSLVELHATAKYLSFREEIDACVFPCLGQEEGCLRLMREISRRAHFVPAATWLAVLLDEKGRRESCGTIQALCNEEGVGLLQNIGVAPEHRGRMLGSLLIRAALEGFQSQGLHRASLEVTARNYGAVRLYHRLGFRRTETVYKAADIVYA